MENIRGVDSMKQVITFLGAEVKKGFRVDQNGDGKVDTMEIIQFALPLATTLPGVLPAFTEGWKESQELSSEEIDEITNHIISTDFLPSEKDRAENYAKFVFKYLLLTKNFGEQTVAFFRGEDVDFDI